MITQLLNLECYTPEHVGKKNILLTHSKICKVGSERLSGNEITTIDCRGLMAFPGIVDGHVHIIGGGGENGFTSRLNELEIDDVVSAGVTTVVGLLGTDNQTKSLKALLAKAKALEEQGITAFIYSGSYEIPIVTFTGDITEDLILIDKVVGAGEIAVSDHRSTFTDINELIKLASKAHIGGLISGKAGIVQLHIGDGKKGLTPVTDMLNMCDLPKEVILPTHVNRNASLFEQAIGYLRSGGYVDLTSDEKAGLPAPEAIKKLLDQGINIDNVTLSSDANGSCPDGSVCRIGSLYDDVVGCIRAEKINPEIIFNLVTENPAKRIKQYPRKGVLAAGSDADILITDKEFNIVMLFSMGKMMLNNLQHNNIIT